MNTKTKPNGVTPAMAERARLKVWSLCATADKTAALPKPEGSETLLPEIFQHQLFLPGIESVTDLDAIKAAIQADPRLKPLAMAITGGNVCVLFPEVEREEKIVHYRLDVPVRSVSLKSLEMRSLARCRDHVAGVAIRLPADLKRLLSAYQICLDGYKKYDWGTESGAKSGFIPEYRKDMAEQLGRKMVGLRFTKISGLQAQVNTDRRVKRNQVAIAQADQLWFLEMAENEGHGELRAHYERHGTLAGARFFLLRYPAVDPNSGRWLILKVLTDRPGQKIYVNAVLWSEMQGGDEDGDLGYLGFTKRPIHFQQIPAVAEFQELTVGGMPADVLSLMLAAWNERQARDPKVEALKKIQNMMVKELTGLVTYTMHCIARGAGARGACGNPNRRVEALTGWMTEVYEIASKLTEQVMDAKKLAKSLTGLYDLAEGLLNGVRGGELECSVFEVFLPKEYQPKMERALSVIGYKLDACRETLYGQVTAAGKKLLTHGPEIVDRCLKAGIQPGEIWPMAEEEAIGLRYVPLEMGERPEVDGDAVPEHLEDIVETEKAKQKDPKKISFVREGKPTSLKEVFSTLRVIRQDGEKAPRPMGPCFTVTNVKEELGSATVWVTFTPAWRYQNKKELRLKLELPIPTPIPGGETEHRLLKLSGVSQRIFRPAWVDGKTQNLEVKCFGWLQKVLVELLQELTHRFHLNYAKGIEREFQDAIVKAVSKLPVDDPHGNGDGLERMVRRREWEIQTRPHDRNQVKIWKERLAILDRCVDAGYAILCTSKNEPGSLVTKANSHGVPAYIHALNALAKFGQEHRWCELREYRESLALAWPTLPQVRLIGSPTWPRWMAEKVANLNVVVADVDELNNFLGTQGERFCVDTLIACPSIRRKMALKELLIECEDEQEKDDVSESFSRAGYTVTAYQGTPEKVGNELEHTPWIVKVLGPIEDDGKIKSLVGPFKGVLNVIPVQLYQVKRDGTSVPIDLIIPWSTMRDKEGWDALLTLFCQILGITEIDPSWKMEDVLMRICEQLAVKDGLSRVMAVHADDRAYDLGELLVGELPFFRPKQTAAQSFRFKSGSRGIKVQPHTMLMAGEIGWQTPKRVYAEFENLVITRIQTMETFWAVSGTSLKPVEGPASAPVEETPIETVTETIIETVTETVTTAPATEARAAFTAARARLAELVGSPLTREEEKEWGPESDEEKDDRKRGMDALLRQPVTPAPATPTPDPDAEWVEEAYVEELPLWRSPEGEMTGLFWDASGNLRVERTSPKWDTSEPILRGTVERLLLQWEKELQFCPNATGAASLTTLMATFKRVMADQSCGGTLTAQGDRRTDQ